MVEAHGNRTHPQLTRSTLGSRLSLYNPCVRFSRQEKLPRNVWKARFIPKVMVFKSLGQAEGQMRGRRPENHLPINTRTASNPVNWNDLILEYEMSTKKKRSWINKIKYLWRKRMGIEPTKDARRTPHRI